MNIQTVIDQWVNTHDFQILINWIKDSHKQLLDLFYKYCRQQEYALQQLAGENDIDWDYQIRTYIYHNKQKIYDKFKEYCTTNFSDYYYSHDRTELNNLIEQTFVDLYKRQVPKLSPEEFDRFMNDYLYIANEIYDSIQPYVKAFKKDDVLNVIHPFIDSLLKKYKTDIKKKRNKNIKRLDQVCKTIIKNIKRDFNSFILKVKFKKEKNGTYLYTWDDVNFTGTDNNNAIDIIEYLMRHKPLLQQLAETSIKQLEQENNINFSNYFFKYYQNKDNYDQQLQNLARNYLLELNKEIMNKRALKLENIKDDNRIGQLTATINYNPYNDTERSAPVIIICNNNKYKIYIGNFGESHSSLQRRKITYRTQVNKKHAMHI